MYGEGLESQTLFGNREWSILGEAYGSRPFNNPVITTDNSKPNEIESKDSAKTDIKLDGENVIGYMGDEEDLQQAQYNVMTLIDQKLDNLNLDLTNKIDRGFNNRVSEITNEVNSLSTMVRNNNNNISSLERINEKELQIISDIGYILDLDEIESDLTQLRSNIDNPSDPPPPRSQNSQTTPGQPPGQPAGQPAGQTNQDEITIKEKGNTYYPKQSKYSNPYRDYEKYPYFLEFEKNSENNKILSDNNDTPISDKICERKDLNNDNACQIQPKMKCKYKNEDGTINKPPSFKHIGDNEVNPDCELKYNPITKVYKCGDYEYQNLLYPHPVIEKEDSKACIMPDYEDNKLSDFIILIIISVAIAVGLALNVSKFTPYRGTILLAITIPILYLYIYYDDTLYDYFLHYIDGDNETIIVSSIKPMLIGCLFPVIIGVIFCTLEL
jgi:hypothetical protein